MSDYLQALFPLILAQLVLPPVSYFNWQGAANELDPTVRQAFEAFYRTVLPESMYNKAFVRSMMLVLEKKSLVPLSDWITWVTHIFVHSDYSHLFNNVQSVLMLGFNVYQFYGAFGMYIMFIAGGIAASLPPGADDIEALYSTVLSYLLPAQPSQATPQSVLAGLISTAGLSKYQKSFQRALRDYKQPRIASYCGSSGATSCFLGCSFAILARDIVRAVYYSTRSSLRTMLDGNANARSSGRGDEDVYYVYSGRYGKDGREFSSRGGGGSDTFISAGGRIHRGGASRRDYNLVARVLFNTYNVATAIWFVTSEYHQMVEQNHSSDSLLGWLFQPFTLINHAAHIKGFAFGCAVTTAFLLVEDFGWINSTAGNYR